MRKLRSKKGFTLTETLLCVALLAIMSAAGAVASGVVISVRNGMIETADAEVLASTALETLADEVRFGREIVVDDTTGDVTQMDSMTFGPGATFSVIDGKLYVDSEALPTTDPAEYHKVLSDSAYTHLKVKDLTMAADKTTNSVTISLTVENSGGKKLWSGSVTVTPLNKLK